MSNYAIWNNRLRHEQLTKVHKPKYLSRRKRARIGIEDANARKSGAVAGANSQAEGAAES